MNVYAVEYYLPEAEYDEAPNVVALYQSRESAKARVEKEKRKAYYREVKDVERYNDRLAKDFELAMHKYKILNIAGVDADKPANPYFRNIPPPYEDWIKNMPYMEGRYEVNEMEVLP